MGCYSQAVTIHRHEEGGLSKGVFAQRERPLRVSLSWKTGIGGSREEGWSGSVIWTMDGQLSRLGIALLQECTVTGILWQWSVAGWRQTTNYLSRRKFKSNLSKFRAMVWHCWRNTLFQMIHQTKGTQSTCSQPDCRHQNSSTKWP